MSTDNDIKVADKFLDLGNYVAGFASAQILAFVISSEKLKHLWVGERPTLLGIGFLFILIYSIVVWLCYRQEITLRDTRHQLYSRYVAIGRIVWIAVFTGMGIGILMKV